MLLIAVVRTLNRNVEFRLSWVEPKMRNISVIVVVPDAEYGPPVIHHSMHGDIKFDEKLLQVFRIEKSSSKHNYEAVNQNSSTPREVTASHGFHTTKRFLNVNFWNQHVRKRGSSKGKIFCVWKFFTSLSSNFESYQFCYVFLSSGESNKNSALCTAGPKCIRWWVGNHILVQNLLELMQQTLQMLLYVLKTVRYISEKGFQF